MVGGGLGRRFWTLWSAFASSNLGDGLSLVGYPLLAVALTDDARLVALVAAARMAPFLIVGLPAGVVIDRFDRRVIAMLAQLGRAAALFVTGAAAAVGSASISLLVATGFAVGIGEVLTDGGLPAVVRDVVRQDQLEDANARLRASETVANEFIGPPVGALVFQIDPSLPFFGAGALYLVTVGLLSALPGRFVADRDEDDEASFLSEMGDGLRYVWGHSILRPLALTVGAFAFVGSAYNAMLVILVTERFGFSEVQYGLLLAVGSVSAVIASFFVSRFVRRTSHGFSMRFSVVVWAIHSAIFGFTLVGPLIVFAALLGGLADPTWNVISATVRQRLVDDRIFGRMMTAYLVIAWSMEPVGIMLGGVVAEQFGPEWVYVVGAVIVGSLLFFARDLFRRIDEAMAVAEESEGLDGAVGELGDHDPCGDD